MRVFATVQNLDVYSVTELQLSPQGAADSKAN